MAIAVAGATGLVGRPLARALAERAERVVPLARSLGVDLVSGAGLAGKLAGVHTIVDVTNSPTQDAAASDYFAQVARSLCEAAAESGVTRLIVLSIIGIDLAPGYYFAAKLAQEQALRKHFAGQLTVLRCAQFHEFAEQSLQWGRDGDRCLVSDLPVQPIALAEVVDQLVTRAISTDPTPDGSLAGPRREQLPDLVRRFARRRGEDVEVIAQDVDPAIADGALLASADTVLAGPTFQEWLATVS